MSETNTNNNTEVIGDSGPEKEVLSIPFRELATKIFDEKVAHKKNLELLCAFLLALKML